MGPPTPKTPLGSPTAEKGKSAEQREIDGIWRQINEKVIQLAGGDPSRIQQLNTAEVIRYIEKVQAADAKKSEKFSTFKNIVSKTLQCIETVGGIVADGVSDVFAPAGLCYNALTFAIQAWRGYEGIFENLGELLEKCVEFLERLAYYEKTMDAKLTRLACQNLQLFVAICDRIVRLRSKHYRLLAFTKQLFLNDNGVAGLLGMMDRLNSKEGLLVAAQTYKIVSDSAGDVKLILDGQREMRREDDAKRWRRAIARVLEFPSGALGDDGEPVPAWQRAFDARKNALVEGTGSWILEKDVFREWTKSTLPKKSVLVLEGHSGSGKTSMMANVIRSLRLMDQGGPTSRAVTAYFFPESDKRKPDEDDMGDFLQTVSRTLLWQIATSYEAMTKSVAQIAERTPYFDGSVDLWQRLLLNNKELMNADTTFFLFIDGVDAEIGKIIPLLEKFQAVVGKEKLRVLLTARPSTIKDWLSQGEGGIKFDMISIPNHNSDDIVKYIQYRMDNMPILKDPTRPGITEWRERILETLRRKCEGDFFKLNTSLDALKKVDLVEDIEAVLADADKTRADQIDAEIRRLNNVRTLKEIQEINEIILWIENGKNWFSVEMMEAILSVKYRTSSNVVKSLPMMNALRGSNHAVENGSHSKPTTLTVSLLPFAQKLLDKYTLFTITDSSKVDWRSGEIKDRIPFKTIALEGGGAPSTGPPQVIQESEVSIVRHFLHNVCPPELYGRFEFESFFDGKIGARHKEFICLDPDNSQIRIARTCLSILTMEELRGRTNIRYYAAYWLLEHLKEVDLSAADREMKNEIGPLLVRLFTDPCGIDALFWPFDLNVSMKTWLEGEHTYLAEARCEYVYSVEGVQEILRWFKDSSVTKFIVDEAEKAFVAGVVTPKANLHKEVLMTAAVHMADHLFRRIEYLPRQFLAACCFLRAFLARLDSDRSATMENEADPYRADSETLQGFDNQNFTLKQISDIETWASKVLNRSGDTPAQHSNWEIHGALITFQLCHEEEKATEMYQARARRAIELDPCNWHACHFISKQPNTSVQEAVQLLTRTKQEIDKMRARDDTWLANTANSALLARITQELGDRLWEEGRDYAAAARVHRESLRYNYAHFKDYAILLDRYRERGDWDEFIAFVEALTASRDVWGEYLDELVKEFLAHPSIEIGGVLAEAADAKNRWDAIEAFFKTAIELAVSRRAHDIVFVLRDSFAATLAHSEGVTHQDAAIKLREAALQDIRLHPSDTLPRAKIDILVDSLAQTYLDRAFHPNISPEKQESYGTLLADLIPDFDGSDVWMSIVPACALIRYHHRRGSSSKVATDWVHRIVREAIELLSDDDEGNDYTAYGLLSRLLATVADVPNFRILWALLNHLQHEACRRWDDWVKAQDATPKTVTDPDNTRSLSSSHSSFVDPKEAKVVDNAKKVAKPSDLNGLRLDTDQSSPSPDAADFDSDDDDGPILQPEPFVVCSGCDKEWVVADAPMFACADCVGCVHLCQACRGRLGRDELRGKKGLTCRPAHEFVELAGWRPSCRIPRGCVPSADGETWITLDEWKGRLRGAYLEG